jgi:hypothetical protein
MSYVDLIIKYLSGDLSREQTTSFEKELNSNSELRDAFEEYSSAYRLIREQLQKRDELNFRNKLREAMSHDHRLSASRRKERWSWWYIPFSAAGLLAVVLIFNFINHPGNERLFSIYYQPARDQVVMAYDQDTRGVTEPGIILYRSGNYARSMEMLSERIHEESENRLLRLYYLLSAIELDRQDEVLELVRNKNTEMMDLPDQAITWYTTLALLKSGNREAALEEIHPLTTQNGPYRSAATRLEKVMLK